jgi:hypothetical protein
VLAHYWVILHQSDAVWVVAAVLFGHVGVTGACGGAHLDNWANIAFFSHLALLKSSRHEP